MYVHILMNKTLEILVLDVYLFTYMELDVHGCNKQLRQGLM